MVTDGSPPNADAVANGGGVTSPQSRRRSLHSPWASVVRGDSEQNSSPTATAAAAAAATAPGYTSSPPVEEASASDNSLIESSGSEPQPESPETNGDSNAGGARRTAWSRPLNGVVEPVSVMGGAISWPALSETTRPVPRSLSDTSRPIFDGSVPASQAPIISQPPQRPASNSAHGNHGNHGNHAGNNPNPARPRSRNRGGGGGGGGGAGGGGGGGGSGGGGGGGSSSGSGPSQSSYSQPPHPMPPPFPVFEVPYGMIPAVLDNPVRGPRPIGGTAAPQSHTGNDHSSQRGNARRGNFGPRPRGDGQYHNNHGGRRDQDRRDVHHPSQYAPPPMGYMPPPLPPGAAPFMAPPPMRVFPGQMGFDMPSPFIYVPPMPPDSFRAMPIVPPPPPMIFPSANEEDVTPKIVKQINFYFSDENLVRDRYLRTKMDDHGWVPISLIASFRRVQLLTKDISLILESLRYSFLVEVQGDKVRRRNDWYKWPLPPDAINSDSGSGPSSTAPENVLATSLQGVSLDDAITRANGIVDAREGHPEMAGGQLSGESSSQSGLANGDNTEEVHSSSL